MVSPAAPSVAPWKRRTQSVWGSEASSDISLDSPELYLNQEYSRLKFNERVLAQATNEGIPLLERLRFLLIFASNMDEFFEIRLAGQKSQIGELIDPYDLEHPPLFGPVVETHGHQTVIA